MSNPPAVERFEGCLLGLMVGDALGLPRSPWLPLWTAAGKARSGTALVRADPCALRAWVRVVSLDVFVQQ